jgi:PAS fold
VTTPAREGQAELDLMPVGIAHVDDVGTIVRANRMLGEMTGLPLDQVVGRSLFDFAAGDMDRYAEMFDFGTGFGTLMGPVPVMYQQRRAVTSRAPPRPSSSCATPSGPSAPCSASSSTSSSPRPVSRSSARPCMPSSPTPRSTIR